MNQSFNITQKVIMLVVTILVCVLSCNINAPFSKDDSAGEPDSLALTPMENGEQCYLNVSNRDSVTLRLYGEGTQVSGSLAFLNHGIDGSSGNVVGEFSGDTLWVMYRFQAEGEDHLKEEAFLKKDGKLWRGDGEQVETERGYTFVDRKKVTFGNFQVLEPVACQ